MLSRLNKLAVVLLTINEDLILDFTKDIIQENRIILEDYNTLQLGEGLRSDGSDIRPEYTPFTVEVKKATGQEYRFPTLKDSGEFWNSIQAKTFNNTLEFIATDPKTPELVQKYGKLILGLSKENKAEFIEYYLKPGIIERINKHIYNFIK